MLTGVVLGYAGGGSIQKSHYALIKLNGFDDARVGQHVGRKVVYTTNAGKKLVGAILRLHGRNGVARHDFDEACPAKPLGKSSRSFKGGGCKSEFGRHA